MEKISSCFCFQKEKVRDLYSMGPERGVCCEAICYHCRDFIVLALRHIFCSVCGATTRSGIQCWVHRKNHGHNHCQRLSGYPFNKWTQTVAKPGGNGSLSSEYIYLSE